MLKINIGCGKLPLEGYKNIDKSPKAKADEYYDLDEGIHEADESVGIIEAGCVLEQVNDLVFVLNECHRVLIPGGVLHGYVPSTDPRVLHLDPMDKHFFQIDSFKYFNGNEHHWKEFGENYGFKPWSETKAEMNENGIIFFTMVK